MSAIVQCNICLGVFEPDRSAEWVRLTKVYPGSAASLFGPVAAETHAVLCPECAGPLMILLGEKRRAAEQQEDRRPAPAAVGGLRDRLREEYEQQHQEWRSRRAVEEKEAARRGVPPMPPMVTDTGLCPGCKINPCICHNLQHNLEPYKEK